MPEPFLSRVKDMFQIFANPEIKSILLKDLRHKHVCFTFSFLKTIVKYFIGTKKCIQPENKIKTQQTTKSTLSRVRNSMLPVCLRLRPPQVFILTPTACVTTILNFLQFPVFKNAVFIYVSINDMLFSFNFYNVCK